MAEFDPDKPYMVLMFVSPIETNEQIDIIREDLARRGIGPIAVGAGIMRADQLELFRLTVNGLEVLPEPWIRKEEWMNHYKFNFLRQYPHEPSGTWAAAFFSEVSEVLPSEKIEKDRDGNVTGIDREALRAFAESEKIPRQRKVKGEKRALFLQSYATTLPALD